MKYIWIVMPKMESYNDLNYEELEQACCTIGEALEKFTETIREFAEAVGKVIGEAIEIIKDLYIDNSKPKYSFVKKLEKKYKQPILKIRYRARSKC